MTFVPVSPDDRTAMLAALGVADVSELWSSIPPELVLDRPLDLPPRLSEMEARRELARLAARNVSAATHASFLGVGAYDHFVPSVVNHLLLRSEFYTAYTPYQPEVSQGTLQAIYEFQSLICALTGMEVANASVYDGASALAEAALMAAAITHRPRLAVSAGVNPAWRDVVATYRRGRGEPAHEVPLGPDGRTDPAALARALGDGPAALLVQSPNWVGVVEDVPAAAEAARAAGALLVVAADPFALGVLEAPGRHGADVVVGEGQGLGNPLSLGGPYLGFLASRREHIRRMPGRIIGRSVDAEGRTAYVMVLQTREQHIRREKATSNLCTNQGLNALAATIYLSAVGRSGFLAAARACFQGAHYAARRIAALPGYALAFEAPFFHEFAVRTPVEPSRIAREGLEAGLLAGIPLDTHPLGRSLPAELEPERLLLVAVTETRTRDEIERLVALLARVGGGRTASAGGRAAPERWRAPAPAGAG
ncbi:MAG TPA: aminomethyl-transferring glycine dehydrogenase subunit GcvPA [Gemmatimonadota bacterium]|jgi:glycine dehydrogenase subunit 1